jgi:hypothetical protein
VKHGAPINGDNVVEIQAALDWLSSPVKSKFVKVTIDFVETVRVLGLVDKEMGTEIGA